MLLPSEQKADFNKLGVKIHPSLYSRQTGALLLHRRLPVKDES